MRLAIASTANGAELPFARMRLPTYPSPDAYLDERRRMEYVDSRLRLGVEHWRRLTSLTPVTGVGAAPPEG